MLLVVTLSALPEVATRVFVTRTNSSVMVGSGSSSSESRTVMVRDPTPLRFLSLVTRVRVGSPRFDMADKEEEGSDGMIGSEAYLCLAPASSQTAEILYYYV